MAIAFSGEQQKATLGCLICRQPIIRGFNFPDDPERRTQWLDRLNMNREQRSYIVYRLQESYTQTRICDRHFSSADIKGGAERARLAPGAVPIDVHICVRMNEKFSSILQMRPPKHVTSIAADVKPSHVLRPYSAIAETRQQRPASATREEDELV
jgi:hypothetical protein